MEGTTNTATYSNAGSSDKSSTEVASSCAIRRRTVQQPEQFNEQEDTEFWRFPPNARIEECVWVFSGTNPQFNNNPIILAEKSTHRAIKTKIMEITWRLHICRWIYATIVLETIVGNTISDEPFYFPVNTVFLRTCQKALKLEKNLILSIKQDLF